MKFPERLLSFSALTLLDVKRERFTYLENIKNYVNSDRFFAIYVWKHNIRGEIYPPFDCIWLDNLKISEDKLNYLYNMCRLHNTVYNLIPIITVFDRCGIMDKVGFDNNPLNKRNGGILERGGKVGLLDFYQNHFSFAVDTIQAVIEALGDCTAVIEPMNETNYKEGAEWQDRILGKLSCPPNIRTIESHLAPPSAMYIDHYYYSSGHNVCNLEKAKKYGEWTPVLPDLIISTDGCRNKGGSYFQGRPGAKEIEPILKWCQENDVGFEHMAKHFDFNGELSEEDHKILRLFQKYQDHHKPDLDGKPREEVK